tara:strand:- start:59 stop:832 length:774 start_codon:yes stop_codon:yes gene_type:complete
MTQKKLPAVMFYTGDWLKEPTLRATSLAARGLWIDMLCFMHESPRRGYLMLTKDVPMQPCHLARAAGTDLDTCEILLGELERNGVMSIIELEDLEDHASAFASRRMIRDETTRQKLSEAGKRGGRPKESQRKARGKPTPKGPGGSSSSDSTSSSTSEEENQIPDELVDSVYSRIPWRARRRPAHTKQAIRVHVHTLSEVHGTVERAAAWLGDRLGDYYASPEGISEYFRNPTTWLEAEGYDEPDEAWASRFKERTEL